MADAEGVAGIAADHHHRRVFAALALPDIGVDRDQRRMGLEPGDRLEKPQLARRSTGLAVKRAHERQIRRGVDAEARAGQGAVLIGQRQLRHRAEAGIDAEIAGDMLDGDRMLGLLGDDPGEQRAGHGIDAAIAARRGHLGIVAAGGDEQGHQPVDQPRVDQHRIPADAQHHRRRAVLEGQGEAPEHIRLRPPDHGDPQSAGIRRQRIIPGAVRGGQDDLSDGGAAAQTMDDVPQHRPPRELRQHLAGKAAGAHAGLNDRGRRHGAMLRMDGRPSSVMSRPDARAAVRTSRLAVAGPPQSVVGKIFRLLPN